MLGEFDDAVSEYEGVLRLSPDYVPALKGKVLEISIFGCDSAKPVHWRNAQDIGV